MDAISLLTSSMFVLPVERVSAAIDFSREDTDKAWLTIDCAFCIIIMALVVVVSFAGAIEF